MRCERNYVGLYETSLGRAGEHETEFPGRTRLRLRQRPRQRYQDSRVVYLNPENEAPVCSKMEKNRQEEEEQSQMKA